MQADILSLDLEVLAVNCQEEPEVSIPGWVLQANNSDLSTAVEFDSGLAQVAWPVTCQVIFSRLHGSDHVLFRFTRRPETLFALPVMVLSDKSVRPGLRTAPSCPPI